MLDEVPVVSLSPFTDSDLIYTGKLRKMHIHSFGKTIALTPVHLRCLVRDKKKCSQRQGERATLQKLERAF